LENLARLTPDSPTSNGIEVADSGASHPQAENAVYYYHFDALGSVMALRDAAFPPDPDL
jgi:hypothetical protein